MTDWNPISAKPDTRTAALLWTPNFDTGITKVSDERLTCWKCTLAFWDGEVWVEGDSGHDVFEDWKGQDDLPTHWVAIEAPRPTKPASAAAA